MKAPPEIQTLGTRVLNRGRTNCTYRKCLARVLHARVSAMAKTSRGRQEQEFQDGMDSPDLRAAKPFWIDLRKELHRERMNGRRRFRG